MSRKRLASSDLNPDSSDALFWNKRVIAGSTFDANRAETSQQPSIVTPPLDAHRAESSRQHVRALNSQFASWVQTQLKNHPDELWEDGVRDYLSHASSIMEKFSDVVKWLEANTSKGENLSAPKAHNTEKNVFPGNNINSTNLFQNNSATSTTATSSFAASWSSGVFNNNTSELTKKNNNTSGLFTLEKKPLPENKDVEVKTQEKPPFAPFSTSSSFVNPWSSGVFSSGQTPVFTGIQNSGPTKADASDDVDDENELEQPSSPSVKKSEEKGIVVVHEVKCKLYVKSTDPADKDAWKDRGAGQLSIKCKEGVSKGAKESKPTIVIRNDVGKVLLNALLYPGIKTSVQKNSVVAIFHTADDGGSTENVMARTFLIRLKTGEDREQLATAIREYAPAS